MALVESHEIHRVSIDEYHRLIESGGLSESTRVELIDGWVVDMSPRSPQHENAIRWLIDWLVRHLDHARFAFMVAGSMTLGASEPAPDIAVIDRTPPKLVHPSRAHLVIEVAVSSRDRDLRTKPRIYAPAVAEYWVVDLERSRVVVHREPAGEGYRSVTVAERGEVIAPSSIGLAELATDRLFAAAYAEK